MALKLASLKRSYKEMYSPTKPVGADNDETYPSLYFDEKTMDQLGLDQLPRVGTEMMMISKVRVSSVNEGKNGARSMSFEIIEAGLQDKDDKPDPASILYPNEKPAK